MSKEINADDVCWPLVSFNNLMTEFDLELHNLIYECRHDLVTLKLIKEYLDDRIEQLEKEINDTNKVNSFYNDLEEF
jgi:hypothetical protein